MIRTQTNSGLFLALIPAREEPGLSAIHLDQVLST
jgi:hypothetical protein